MKEKLLTILSVLFLGTLATKAQQGKALVRNSPQHPGKTIEIKWLSQSITYPEGVKIYRMENNSGKWVPLTNKTLKKKDSVPRQEYKKDPNLELFVELMKQGQDEKTNSFLLLNILVQAFKSNIYADFLGIYYQDNSVNEGNTYQYKINKIIQGKERHLATSPPIKAGSYQAKAPLKNIEYKRKKKSVHFKWEPEESRYFGVNIYRKSSYQSSYKKITQRPIMLSKTQNKSGKEVYPEIMYKDDSLQENTSYTYKLAGVDFFGAETQHSPEYQIRITDLTPPPAAENIKATSNGLSVSLTWTQDLTGNAASHAIFRSKKSNGPFIEISGKLSAGTMSYIEKVNTPGPYYYYVSTYDDYDNEAKSQRAFIEVHDIEPPAKPQGLTARGDTGKVHLAWKANPEGDVIGYYVYRSIKGKPNTYSLLNTEPVKKNHFTDKRPINAKNNFFYKIAAVDSVLNVSEKSDVSIARLPDVTPPEPPHIKNIKKTGEGVKIEWVKNVEPDLQGYHVFRSKGAAPEDFEKINVGTLSPTVSRFTDRKPGTGKKHYRIVASDKSANNSLPSETVHIELPASHELNIKAPKIKIKYRKLLNAVELKWAETDKQNIRGYILFRHQKGQTAKPLTGLIQKTQYLDKKIQKGETYSYKLHIYLKNGKEVKTGENNIHTE